MSLDVSELKAALHVLNGALKVPVLVSRPFAETKTIVVGATVNGYPLEGSPSTVTWSEPVVAALPSWAMMAVLLQLHRLQSVTRLPPSFTVLLPCEVPK